MTPANRTSSCSPASRSWSLACAPTPDPAPDRRWHARRDPFSQYRAGFELRTHRLCQRVLMFHWFQELGPEASAGLDPERVPARSAVATLVRSVDLTYDENPSLSRLISVTHKGYLRPAGSTGPCTVKAFPPVELGYTKAYPQRQVKQLDRDTAEVLTSRTFEGHQWVDLESEGLPGVLSKQGGALFYQRNEGGGHFAPPRRLRDRPVIAAGVSPQILDLGGDGQRELVQVAPPVAGYHARTADDGWGPFIPFASQPNIDWNDPNLRFIDLSGDGLDDLLLVGATSYVWYPSLGKRGFGPARTFPRGRDDERGPTVVFSDPRQTVFLADMSGDGLTDLVRIDNGSVCYWPNLGHGKFGAKVVMANAPRFAPSTQFDARRIRLGDIDGSGTTDVLYVGGEGGVRVWFNQAGNGWSGEQQLAARGVPRRERAGGRGRRARQRHGVPGVAFAADQGDLLPGPVRRPEAPPAGAHGPQPGPGAADGLRAVNAVLPGRPESWKAVGDPAAFPGARGDAGGELRPPEPGALRVGVPLPPRLLRR
ncbi:Hypothetical protein CAP_5142 [Chondromyces apiculatus DSM 436]|uniref:VCBS repeat-containing protein n=1 Tax=Chondromyces apiculatus DSM 436 TaxID=1192034 RepID=A0A017T3Q3_9BACT|nr:Hypothetical protein CAP_5142 [Chondromyces apiculatus DSM 436]